jgi:hypothetical protein
MPEPWPSGPDPLPGTVIELTLAERLVVLAFRHWVVGWTLARGAHWEDAAREFVRSLAPEDAAPAFSAFVALVHTLCAHARRAIRTRRPCWPSLEAGEAELVAFLAACQWRRGAGLAAAAGRLVEDEAAGDLIDRGQRLVRHLARSGLVLPERCAPPAVGPTLH